MTVVINEFALQTAVSEGAAERNRSACDRALLYLTGDGPDHSNGNYQEEKKGLKKLAKSQNKDTGREEEKG